MNYRVTSSTYTATAVHFSKLHNSTLFKYQQQITSGLKFQRPSEEPIAFRHATALRTRYSELSADRSNIDRTTSLLNTSSNEIQTFSQVITSAKLLAQQGVGSLDNDERNALATEVDGLLDQLKGISLSQFNDKYLFGGTRTEQPPFTFADPLQTSGTLQVTYNGASARSRASVGDSIAVDTYYSGLEVFGSNGRKATHIIGTTGAAPGVGTDTLVGRADLIVTHDTTIYSGTSGIQPGASSAAQDTIIGPPGVHTLTIEDTSGNGSAGTISLNGRPAVAFTNADTNLAIEGAGGQVIYVDASNITAGFSGTIDIEATGRLSVDGGASSVAIDFSNNQVVEDSNTQLAATIDSSNIRSVGTDHLEFIGTSNAFQVLYELSADLRNERGLDSQALSQAIDRRLGELSSVGERAFDMLAQQATSLKTLQTLSTRVDDLMISVQSQVSDVQATDIPEAVLNLERSQSLLQYTYAVTGQLTSLGLLNFLR